MNFQPRSAKEVAEMGLMPKGNYDFEVVTAEEKISSKGNAMIEIKLKVYFGSRERFLWDWLTPKFESKLRYFCESTGLLPVYERGELTADDCIGRSGKATIGIEGDEVSGKNRVANYVVSRLKPQPIQTSGKTIDEQGEALPF